MTPLDAALFVCVVGVVMTAAASTILAVIEGRRK